MQFDLEVLPLNVFQNALKCLKVYEIVNISVLLVIVQRMCSSDHTADVIQNSHYLNKNFYIKLLQIFSFSICVYIYGYI